MSSKDDEDKATANNAEQTEESINRKKTLVIDEETMEKCEIATCCHPIPGDDVLGYIAPDGKIQIHKRRCSVATKLKTRFGNNIIATRWNLNDTREFEASVYIKGVDRAGTLHAIADMIQNYSTLRHIVLDANDGIFEGKLTFLVHNRQDVTDACQQLLKIENIEAAYRC